MSVLKTLASVALRVLAPPRCAACDASLARDVIFCPLCAQTIEAPAGQEGGRSAAAYGGAIAASIVRFKFEGRTDLARPLSHLLMRSVADDRPACDVVLAVPLHRARLHERGYNQAALLARPVAAYLARPFEPLAIRRTRPTLAQATLGAEHRRANVRGCFRVVEPGLVRGRSVLLVDDVRTTGATLDGCRTALIEAGAREVRFLTVAQA
jgi:ComF family protein